MKLRFTIVLALALVTACGGQQVDPAVARGRQLFSEHCVACHSITGDVVIVGPSLAGIASRTAANNENLESRAILRRSITSPGAEIVEGFDNLMPPDFERKLSEADLEALLSYLLTLE